MDVETISGFEPSATGLSALMSESGTTVPPGKRDSQTRSRTSQTISCLTARIIATAATNCEQPRMPSV